MCVHVCVRVIDLVYMYLMCRDPPSFINAGDEEGIFVCVRVHVLV